MISLLKKWLAWGYALSTATIAFIPDFPVNNVKWLTDLLIQYNIPNTSIVIAIKFLFLIACLLAGFIISLLIYFCFTKRTIKFGHYTIELLYGDIFKYCDKSLKVIPFDECFTLDIGKSAHQIKPTSLCGQYLAKYPPDNDLMQNISNTVHNNKFSQHNNNPCAESGTIIERDDFILLAFAKLDYEGKGHLTNREYIESLMTLWDNLDKYSSQYNICVPVLGSNITRFDNGELTKQQLLNIMIQTYMLASHKIKSPSKLIIVCKRSENFSIWDFKY